MDIKKIDKIKAPEDWVEEAVSYTHLTLPTTERV